VSNSLNALLVQQTGCAELSLWVQQAIHAVRSKRYSPRVSAGTNDGDGRAGYTDQAGDITDIDAQEAKEANEGRARAVSLLCAVAYGFVMIRAQYSICAQENTDTNSIGASQCRTDRKGRCSCEQGQLWQQQG